MDRRAPAVIVTGASRGIEASYPGLYRFVSVHICTPSKTTVRMADTAPGEVAEVDFGKLGDGGNVLKYITPT